MAKKKSTAAASKTPAPVKKLTAAEIKALLPQIQSSIQDLPEAKKKSFGKKIGEFFLGEKGKFQQIPLFNTAQQAFLQDLLPQVMEQQQSFNQRPNPLDVLTNFQPQQTPDYLGRFAQRLPNQQANYLQPLLDSMQNRPNVLSQLQGLTTAQRGNPLAALNAYSAQQPTPGAETADLMGQTIGALSGNTPDYGPIAEQARRQFATRTIPSIAERFTAMGGGQRSSAFQGALGSAASDLESQLAAGQSQYNLARGGELRSLLGQLQAAREAQSGRGLQAALGQAQYGLGAQGQYNQLVENAARLGLNEQQLRDALAGQYAGLGQQNISQTRAIAGQRAQQGLTQQEMAQQRALQTANLGLNQQQQAQQDLFRRLQLAMQPQNETAYTGGTPGLIGGAAQTGANILTKFGIKAATGGLA
jgi:hypothetical protein